MARKFRGARRVVRGPQLKLKLGRGPEPARNARLRYVEPPTARRRAYDKAMPFYAVRVPAKLREAFLAKAKKLGKRHQDIIRAYMSKLTGVRVEVEERDDG